MLCFLSKVTFWILWNYRGMTRNTEYWESLIILCKPLTPPHSPFSWSDWLIQVNLRQKNYFKKAQPSSNSSLLGIGKVLLWSHLAGTAKTALAGTNAELGEKKPHSVADPSSSGVLVFTWQSGFSGCRRIREWLKWKGLEESVDHLLCTFLCQLSYSFFTHSGKSCEHVPLCQMKYLSCWITPLKIASIV